MRFNFAISRVGTLCLLGSIAGLSAGPVAAQTAAAGPTENLEEVTVTGSRLQAAGFNAPTPVTVVTTETIEQRAPANISDVLLEQPAIRITGTDYARNGSGGGNANPLSQGLIATPDLRSLGSNRTLVLINGHRSVLTSWGGAVDINIVPVGMVERIESVTGGASAQYGSDAIAGVVNVILRSEMQGIKAGAQVGLTEYGSGKQYTYNLSGGTALFDGRMHVLAGIDVNKTDAITNVYGKRWAQDEIGQYTPQNSIPNPYRTANNLPANVIATGVEPASFAPSGALYYPASSNQYWASGPAYSFDANGNPVAFSRGVISSNGQYMIGSTSNYGHNLNDLTPIRLPEERFDFMTRESFDFTDSFGAYLEFGNSRNLVLPYKAGELSQGAGVGANNPAITIAANNPFRTAAINAVTGAGQFSIGRNDTELGLWGLNGIDARQDSETRRLVLGLDGRFGDSWKWDAYYQDGRTWTRIERDDLAPWAMQKAVNGCNTSAGLNANQIILVNRYEATSGKACVPFNPFLQTNSAAAIDYIQNYTQQTQHLWMDVAAASISGTPFKLPAGDLAVAAGAEWRAEKLSAVSDPVSKLGNAIEGSMLTNSLVESIGENSVREAFAEVGIPVLKNAPMVHSLDLNAAVRFTKYELSGNVHTWKAGFTWDVTDEVRLRLTKSHDIRAGSLMQLFFFGGPNSGNLDLTRLPAGTVGANGSVYAPPGGNLSSVPVLSSGGVGNPYVRPEIADTVTGGMVFTKSGFSASVDYYYINMHDTIAGLPAQTVVDNCVAGDKTACGYITFSPASIGPGIQLISAPNINLNRSVVKGLDFETAYHRPLGPGSFQVRALVNYQPHNESVNYVNGQTTDSANTLGSQPKLAYNLNFGYDVSRWSADVQIRGFGERRGNNIVYNADGSISANTILGPEDGAAYNARVASAPATVITVNGVPTIVAPAGTVAASNNTINKNRWPGQFFVNPSVTYKVNDNLQAYFNVDNLFDKQPPELATSAVVYDLVGRRYRLGVRASF